MRGVFLFRSRSARRKAIGSKQSGKRQSKKAVAALRAKNDIRSGSKKMPRCVATLSQVYLRFRANLKYLEMNANAQRNPPLSPTFGAAANGQPVFFLLAGTIRRPSQNDHQKSGPIGPLPTAQPLLHSPQANYVERREPRVGRVCR